MKKKSLFATALLSATMLMTPLVVNAEGDENWYVNDNFSVSCDAFQYSTHWCNGITLKTELTDANFMVSGIAHADDGSIKYIVLTSINGGINGMRGIMWTCDELKPFFPAEFKWEDFRLGDLLRFGDHIDQPLEKPIINPTENVEVLGNGIDILGEEFRKVIRHELIAVPRPGWEDTDAIKYFDVLKGDVNENDTIDILDVVALNKNLMEGYPLGCYSKYVADVNENNTPDSTDSLMILKELVGLTKDFVEQ